jgi:membrane protein YqaA with SNARE-associated domain
MMVDPTWALAGLAASAFLSATLLPGNSELVLAGFLAMFPSWLWPALLVATLANSAGGATSFWLGRAAPPKKFSERWEARLKRYGPVSLLASWTPVVGDFVTVAAGWLRFPFWSSTLWMTLGKAVRYIAIAALIPGVSLLG